MVTQVYNLRLLNPINTAQTWTALNPILFENEIGVESDTGLFKIGNNISPWKSLPYSRSALNELKEGNSISIENNIISVNLRYDIIEEYPDD